MDDFALQAAVRLAKQIVAKSKNHADTDALGALQAKLSGVLSECLDGDCSSCVALPADKDEFPEDQMQAISTLTAASELWVSGLHATYAKGDGFECRPPFAASLRLHFYPNCLAMQCMHS
jgi:hypothetical protein